MLELSKYPSLDMDNIYETIQQFEENSKLYLQRNWKTSKFKMKSLRLRRIFPPWHGWGLEEPTVLHLDTICSRGRAPPPLLGSEGILFEKYLVFKYLKATLVILYNLKILLIPLFIRFNVKLVFRKRKRGITTVRYFHQKGIFVTNLHFPHIQTPDPGHSSDIRYVSKYSVKETFLI